MCTPWETADCAVSMVGVLTGCADWLAEPWNLVKGKARADAVGSLGNECKGCACEMLNCLKDNAEDAKKCGVPMPLKKVM